MPKNMDTGFLDALNQHNKHTEELSKTLEGLPQKYEQFAAEDLNRLIEINKELSIFRETQSQSQEVLDEIVRYLDTLNIWATKFTTGESGASAETDSVYYVTNHHIALRLKKSELSRGLNHVIQPFMENIVFIEASGEGVFSPLEQPVVGSTPMEYTSQEFHQVMTGGEVTSAFVSQVPKFYKDGKLYFVGRPQNLFHEHPGSSINHIYF